MRKAFYISIFLVFSLIPGIRTAGSADAVTEAGKYAPLFELKDLDGKKTALSQYRGKVVLLNFWATWCSPCRSEMPSLTDLYSDFKDRGFVVLAVSVDTSERSVKSFVSAEKIGFPVLVDKDKDVYFDQYGIVGIPVSFLIDRNGLIAEKFVGERQWNSPEMKNKILRLLGEGTR